MEETTMNPILKRNSVFMLVIIFLFSSVMVPALEAKIIGTAAYLDQQSHSAKNGLQSFLSREDVKDRLIELGVDPKDATARVAMLTDAEATELQAHIQDLPAGSSVFALLGVVLVVLIVLELIGVTNVFTKI